MACSIFASVRTADLRRLANGWLLNFQYRNLSPCTLELRRSAVEKWLYHCSCYRTGFYRERARHSRPTPLIG